MIGERDTSIEEKCNFSDITDDSIRCLIFIQTLLLFQTIAEPYYEIANEDVGHLVK